MSIRQWNVANLIGHWTEMNHISIVFHDLMWIFFFFFFFIRTSFRILNTFQMGTNQEQMLTAFYFALFETSARFLHHLSMTFDSSGKEATEEKDGNHQMNEGGRNIRKGAWLRCLFLWWSRYSLVLERRSAWFYIIMIELIVTDWGLDSAKPFIIFFINIVHAFATKH